MVARGGGWLSAAAHDDEPQAADPDLSVAHPARIWDYWLDGKDNFAADRAAGDYVLEAAPDIVKVARADRAFLASAVRYLAGGLGIRQFLDIGAGLPAGNSVHEVAQKEAPESRVVYVDNDQVVLSHARALFTSGPRGAVAYVDSDARDTGKILAATARTLDLSQPVAVMLLNVLPFIPDADDPWKTIRELIGALSPGSLLSVFHGASDIRPAQAAEVSRRYNERSAVPLQLRTRDEFTRFFDGLDLIRPGIVPVNHWQPGLQTDSQPEREEPLPAYAALARKPVGRL